MYLVIRRAAPTSPVAAALLPVFLVACITKEGDKQSANEATAYLKYKQRWRDCYVAMHDISACDALAGHAVYPTPQATNLQQKLDWLEERGFNLFRERRLARTSSRGFRRRRLWSACGDVAGGNRSNSGAISRRMMPRIPYHASSSRFLSLLAPDAHVSRPLTSNLVPAASLDLGVSRSPRAIAGRGAHNPRPYEGTNPGSECWRYTPASRAIPIAAFSRVSVFNPSHQ